MDVEWYTAGDNLETIDTIKNIVMRNGVMATTYYASGSLYSSSTNSHYQAKTSSSDPNHSVAIIGWDDNKRTQASEDGAFLVKNSWGPDRQAFFYISYYDKHCAQQPEMGAVSFYDVQPVPFHHVYYHDYHGWRDTKWDSKEGFCAFTAERDDFLVAVGFYTTADHEEWEVKVYRSFTNGELQDELASASGNIVHTGYHTRYLNKPVTLAENEDFYIYLKVKNGGLAYDRTSYIPVMLQTKEAVIVKSTASPEESYYKENDEWLDFFAYDDTSKWDETNSFCMKAFTLDTMPVSIFNPDANIPQTRFGMYNYPNPFASQTTIKYALAEKGAVSLGIYNARGRLVRSLVKSSEKAGAHQISWNGRDEFNKPLSSGIYYSILTVKTNRGIATEKRKLFMVK
jgi:hypothetical protein